jgi:hypothetical protein
MKLGSLIIKRSTMYWSSRIQIDMTAVLVRPKAHLFTGDRYIICMSVVEAAIV